MSVYTAGGPHSGFEKAATTSLKKISPKMVRLQKEITAIMSDALAHPQRSGAYWRGVETKLAQKYNQIQKAYWQYAGTAMPASYRASLVDVAAQLAKSKSYLGTARRTVAQLVRSPATAQITNALLTDAVASMDAAIAGGMRNARRLTRMTQQAIIQEWTLDAAVAESFGRGNVAGSFADTLAKRSPEYARLLESFEGQRVIQAGSKTFTPEYYAELVSRTKFHEAQFIAAKQQATNYNTDLVVVSNHNTTTVICQQYEAKTFSISGKSKQFPVLDQGTPFHPNCLHLTYPVFEEAMIIDGTLEGQSQFSLGKSNAPPVPAGFIPVSKRSL